MSIKDGQFVVFFSVIAAIVFAVLDTVLDPHFHSESFFTLLVYGGASHEFFMRLVVYTLFILMGVISANLLNKRWKAEKALSRKKAYFNNILNSSLDTAIVTTDSDLNVNFCNPVAEKSFNIKARDVVGKPLINILKSFNVPEERLKAALQNINEHRPHSYTATRETAGGTSHIEGMVYGIYDETGELVGYASFTKDITERRIAEHEREHLISELQNALSKVDMLHGLLPICSYCKKIRDDQGYWSRIETYVSKHSTAEFSHGVCPQCEKRLSEENPRIL